MDPYGLSVVATGITIYEVSPYIIAGASALITAGYNYFKAHTKNARSSTHDKHAKKRAGAPSKAEKKKDWKSRSNKRRP